jgi:drug/metabolite transporter (DMT)-like permease
MFMFYRLIQARGPLFAGMVTYLIPIGAVAWGWADGEPVSTRQLVALAVILAAVALVQWPERQNAD